MLFKKQIPVPVTGNIKKMKRNTRAEKAQETLAIIEQGFYETKQNRIILKEDIHNAVTGSRLYPEDGFETVLQDAALKAATLKHNTEILVQNTTVLKAAAAMTMQGEKVGCLNFASAKNPGGGFLGGAQAQEESLALSSALYPTLMEHFEMYTYNRERKTLLYADHMIYSPEVPVFRNDDGDLLEQPYRLSFITSPAVNIGAIKQHNADELVHAEATMLRRMDKVLGLFVHHNIEHLLLGAWGCGVFQNNPADIAFWFASFLRKGGKYSTSFKRVVFAVYDRSKEGHNITAFEKELSPF